MGNKRPVFVRSESPQRAETRDREEQQKAYDRCKLLATGIKLRFLNRNGNKSPRKRERKRSLE